MQIFPIIPHDSLSGFVANEHIDWTGATQNLLTTGSGTFDSLAVDTDTLVVDAVNHRVGIGTATPSYPVDVLISAGTTAGRMYSTVGSVNLLLQSDIAGASGSFVFTTGSYTRSSIGGTVDSGGGSSGILQFKTRPLGGSIAESMRINSAGNVGINETSPQDKLEVNGTVLVKDKLKFTQDDGNEFIDSLADGYLDYGATTAHRFNAPVRIGAAPPEKMLGVDGDAYVTGDLEADGQTYLYGGASVDGRLQAQDDFVFPDDAPGSPATGSTYFDAGTNTINCWNGSAWVSVALS